MIHNCYYNVVYSALHTFGINISPKMAVASNTNPAEYIAARACRYSRSVIKLIIITTIIIEVMYITPAMYLASLSPLTLTFLVAKAKRIPIIWSIAL